MFFQLLGTNLLISLTLCALLANGQQPPDCSGHGDLQTDGTCICNTGWKDTICDKKECFNGGAVVPVTGGEDTCNCIGTGYFGTSCEKKCLNGGSTNSKGDGCDCLSYWTGVNCTETQCINGGFLSPDHTYCNCPPGYLGIHCEARLKIPEPLNAFRTERSFNIYMFNEVSPYIGQLAFDDFINAIRNDPFFVSGYYEKYTLQVQNTTTMNEVFSCDNATVFTEELNKFANTSQPLFDWSCYDIEKLYEQLFNHLSSNRLMQTVLTVFTQHPGLVTPTTDPSLDYYHRLLDYAIAFGVQINVAFSSDDALIGCGWDDDSIESIRNMKTLVEATSGIFLEITNDKPEETVDAVKQLIVMAAGQQKYDFMGSADCSKGVSLTVNPEKSYAPYNYTAIVRKYDSSAVTTVSGGLCAPTIIQKDMDVSLYRFTGHLVDECVFNVKGNGPCFIQVVRNPYATYSAWPLDIYVSFVENKNLDTSNIQMLSGGQFYVALHLRNDSLPFTVKKIQLLGDNGVSSKEITVDWRDSSTFEYISSDRITCNQGGSNKFWLKIFLEDTLFKHNDLRYVAVDCYSTGGLNPTVSPTTTTTAPMTTTTMGPPITTGGCDATTYPPKRAVVFGFSYRVDDASSSDYSGVLQESYVDELFDNFGYLSYDASGVAQKDDAAIVNLTTLKKLMQQSQSDPSSLTSTAVKQLSAFVDLADGDARIPDTAAIILLTTVNVTTSLLSTSYLEKCKAYFTNKRHPVFPVFVAPTLPSNGSNTFYSDLAAMTNGHYIVVQEPGWWDIQYEAPIHKVVRNLIQNIATSELMFAKNYVINASIEKTIGEIDLTGFASGTYTFYYSVSTEIDDLAIMSNTVEQPLLLLTVYNSSGSVVASGDHLPSPNLYEDIPANFYGVEFTLPAGDVYKVAVQHLDTSKWAFSRVWRIHNTNDADKDDTGLTYKYVSSVNTGSGSFADEDPNRAIGMTIRGATYNLKGVDSVSAILLDCNGNPLIDKNGKELEIGSTLFGDYTTTCIDAYFGPHFFDKAADNENKCPSKTLEDSYGLQVVVKSGDKVLRQYRGNVYYASTFAETCPTGVTTNPDKTCDCAAQGNQKTGPLCQFMNCNDNGDLVYNTTDTYRCACFDNYEGDNCDKGKCIPGQEHGRLDTQVRTVTVLVGVQDAVSTNYSSLTEMFTKESFDYSNVWQFHLIAFKDAETAQSVYIGGNFGEFLNSFEVLNTAVVNKTNNSTIDFSTKTLQHAFKAVGTYVYGVVFILNPVGILLFNDEVESFYAVMNPYMRHQIYIAIDTKLEAAATKLDDEVFDPLANMAQSTGGALLTFNTTILSLLVDQVIPYSQSLNELSIVDSVPKTISINLESQYGTATVIATANCELASDTGITVTPDPVSGDTPKTTRSGATVITVQECTTPPCATKLDLALNECEKMYVSAMVQGGFSPIVRVVKSISDDEQSALPVTTTKPKMIIHKEPHSDLTSYNITVTAGQLQNIQDDPPRTDCTFQDSDEVYGSTAEFNYTVVGFHPLKLDIAYGYTTGSPGTVSKTFPLVFVNQIDCGVNGKSNSKDSSSCLCNTGFTGPDCRKANCNGGKPNAFETACNCKESKRYGEFCEL